MDKTTIEFYNKSEEIAKINCDIAKTFFQKIKGLMYREKLSSDKGMIFIFSIPWIRSFWMKYVKIPLDIIFINRKKEIIKIYEAEIEKGIFYKIYNSKGFCKYVIEVNKGFCKKYNIKEKDKINFL